MTRIQVDASLLGNDRGRSRLRRSDVGCTSVPARIRRLGHDVFFVEPMPSSKLQPAGCGLADSSAARWFRRVVRAFGLSDSAALLLEGTTETVGLTHDALRRVAARADAIFNISGMLTDAALLDPIPRRIYLDLDPGFNQAWHCCGDIDMRFDAHTHFATVGLAVGKPECRVPTCGRQWLTTCPPVVLREWPVAPMETRGAITTVANWRSYRLGASRRIVPRAKGSRAASADQSAAEDAPTWQLWPWPSILKNLISRLFD